MIPKNKTFNIGLSIILLAPLAILQSAPMALAQNNEEAAKVAAPSPAVSALTSTMPLAPNTIADIAQMVAPAVVNIEVNLTGPKMNMTGMPGFPGFNSPFEFFFNGQRVTPNQMQKGVPMPQIQPHNTGSGFVIRSDGYILTNAHVVRGATKIKVTLNDKRVLDGTVLGTDSFSDIAVVKVPADNLPVARLGTSKNLRPGDFAIAIGSPLGYDHTVTFGIISAIGREVSDINGNVNFIQTDAAINPGNSGGPLLNLAGDVIGINTAIQANAQNIGFSIPVDVVKDVADALIANKKIERPWLGIVMEPMNETIAKSLGLPASTNGVFVARLIQGSPAQAAGLESGDIIQKIDGKEMLTAKDVQQYVREHKVKDILHFLVLRQNTVKAMAVNIGQYPEKIVGFNARPEDSQPDE